MRYRKKPVEVEAIQWTGENLNEVASFLGTSAFEDYPTAKALTIWNFLEETWIPCHKGHWIIKGVAGEFYPCDPDVFARTYEKV